MTWIKMLKNQSLSFVGWPGRTHDARVLTIPPLYRKVEEQGGYLFVRDVSRNVDGVEVPAHLVGDAAYPLRTWLMKGFTQHRVLDANQWKFNKALNSARIVLEHAFGRLKGRWRCLSKRFDVATAFVPDVVFACCMLHNICELNQENILLE
ncbi:uncharacterized protein [Narcine bancroftii]|uniref:uncharacterized protein n=1 Tax=Narcine bancroftii TaxID=1343680 RepID=UPI0038316B87